MVAERAGQSCSNLLTVFILLSVLALSGFNRPVFATEFYVEAVPENSAANTLVGTIVGAPGAPQFRHGDNSLSSTSEDAFWTIVFGGGVYYIKTASTPVDFEAYDAAGDHSQEYTIYDGSVDNTISITVSDVNEEPAVDDFSVTAAEDAGSHLIDLDTESGVTDPESDQAGFKIFNVVLGSSGTLHQFDGTQPNNVGTEIITDETGTTVEASDGFGKIVFVPAADYNGSSVGSITYKAYELATDDTFHSDAGTISIDITAINDAPVNAIPGTQSTDENATLELSFANDNLISVGDVDAGGNEIQLQLIAPDGTLTLGSVTGLAFSGGDGTEDGSMAFVGTISAINNALDGLVFTPDSEFDGSTTIQVISSDLGFTGSGGNLSDTDSLQITVINENDAPVLDDSVTMQLTDVSEDTATEANDGTTVADVLATGAGGDPIFDIDSTAQDGIAVITVDDTDGTWQYTANGGLVWNEFGTVSDSGAVVLSATDDDRIRFLPDADWNGTAQITIRAWDMSDGLDSGTTDVDASAGGGTFPFSTTGATVEVTVSAVNDPPVNTVPEAQSTPEDSAVVFSDALTISVADSDVEDGDLEITLTVANGTVTLGDAGPVAITGGADGSATVVFTGTTTEVNTALDGLTFAPDADFDGAASLQVMANDLGNTGGGGVQSDIDTIVITVVNENDAPVLDTSGNPIMASISEDNLSSSGDLISSIISTLGGNGITDVDSGAVEGIAITAVAGNASFESSVDGGSTWTGVGSVSETQALLLRTGDRLRGVPDGNNGETATFTFRAWDQSGATPGQHGTKVNISATGGTTAFSSAVETASLPISDVNDAPTMDNTGDMYLTGIDEDTINPAGDTVSDIINASTANGGNAITDLDTGAIEGIAIFEAGGNGAWHKSIDNGNTWSVVGTVASDVALLLRATDKLRYMPDQENGETATIHFYAWDQSSYTHGSKVNTETRGGTSPFSVDSEIATIAVASVNDTPVDIAIDSASVAENQGLAVAVGTFSTTDVDQGDSFSYTLASGTGDDDNGFFNIADDTLVTAASFDAESQGLYSIRVRTMDSSSAVYDKAFAITITNVNEAPTDIGLSSNQVNENQPAGTTVCLLSSQDPDIGDTFTYALVSGDGDTDNDSFSITGTSLKTNESFHYDTKEFYSIRIQSTDAGGLTYQETNTIQVLNLNIAPVVENQIFDVDENSATGTSVGTVEASDSDPEDTLTYSITGGNDLNAFDIGSSTGVLTVDEEAPLDFETYPQINLT